MVGIRRLIGGALAGVVMCGYLLLAAPAGGATGVGSRLQPPPPQEPSPLRAEPLLPTLILVPATGSAGTQVQVIGRGFAACVTGHGELESSGNGEVSVLATGDVSLFWDGMDPLTILRLDEELGFVASLEIADSASPGSHRVVSRCAGDEGDAGSADFIVTPPPEAAADVPSESPADVTVTDPAPQASTVPPGRLVDAVVAAPDNPDRGSAAQHQSPSPDALVFSGNPAKNTAAEPSLPGAGPTTPWGTLVGLLALVGAALGVPSLSPFILEARRGPKWVRANVRAVPRAGAAVGTELIPGMEEHWPPTSVVRFALHADSGTQVLTEVQR